MKYWIMWTYLGNHSERPTPVEADSPEEARKKATSYFSEDFQQKGTVYVFEDPPVLTFRRGQRERDPRCWGEKGCPYCPTSGHP